MKESVIVCISIVLIFIIISSAVIMGITMRAKSLIYYRPLLLSSGIVFFILIGIKKSDLYQSSSSMFDGFTAVLFCLCGYILVLILSIVYCSLCYCILGRGRSTNLIDKLSRILLYIALAFIAFELFNNFADIGLNLPTVIPVCYVLLYFIKTKYSVKYSNSQDSE